jgi:hypothetical protein
LFSARRSIWRTRSPLSPSRSPTVRSDSSRQARAMRKLVAARLASRLAHDLVVGLLEACEVAQRAVGEDDRARELGHELLHRLAHPPPPQRHAALGIEALERAQEPDDALLQQLQALHLAAAVRARDRGDERHEDLDEPRPCRVIAALGGQHEAALIDLRELRAPPELLDVRAGDGPAHRRAPPHVIREVAVQAVRTRDVGTQLLGAFCALVTVPSVRSSSSRSDAASCMQRPRRDSTLANVRRGRPDAGWRPH